MSAVANDYLMKRYPSRRKAYREPIVIDQKDRNKFSRKSISAYHSMKHIEH